MVDRLSTYWRLTERQKDIHRYSKFRIINQPNAHLVVLIRLYPSGIKSRWGIVTLPEGQVGAHCGHWNGITRERSEWKSFKLTQLCSYKNISNVGKSQWPQSQGQEVRFSENLVSAITQEGRHLGFFKIDTIGASPKNVRQVWILTQSDWVQGRRSMFLKITFLTNTIGTSNRRLRGSTRGH